MTQLKVACIQLNATDDINANKARILDLLTQEKATQADLIALPECALYRATKAQHKEPIDGDSIRWFQERAVELNAHILVGSFFEQSLGEKAYNSSVLINNQGHVIQSYRKMNLFDVKLDDNDMQESNTFMPGKSPAMADINGFKFGLSICYDLRFPELYRHYVAKGCSVLTVPASFTKSTGKLHWHALLRARAIENQCYVIAPNQFGKGANDVDTYGHSLIIDPLGNILAEAPADAEAVISATLDLAALKRIRARFPVLKGIIND